MALLELQISWVDDTLEGAFLRWWRSRATKALQALPLIISWGVWLAKNDAIFKDIIKIPTEIAIKVVGIVDHFVESNTNMKYRNIMQESTNLEVSWGYFDGAAGRNPSLCGGGAVLFFNLQNYINFKEALGLGTNNFVELSALILLMTKALEWSVTNMQIFGDSKIIIN